MFIGSIAAIVGTLFSGSSALIGLILIFFGGIFTLLGMYKAGQDAKTYRTALIIHVVRLVLNLVSGAVPLLKTILEILSPVLGFAVVYLVCRTTVVLLRALERDRAARQGELTAKIYLVSAVVNVLSALGILPGIVGTVLMAIAVTVSVVSEIMYIIFLNKSSKQLVVDPV